MQGDVRHWLHVTSGIQSLPYQLACVPRVSVITLVGSIQIIAQSPPTPPSSQRIASLLLASILAMAHDNKSETQHRK